MLSKRKKILFLCTGNSCRSQMAEAWAKAIRGDEWQVFSAGIEAHGMNPLAIAVMAESGLDITRQYSKTLAQLNGQVFDVVVTVCDHAANHCPVLPLPTLVIHMPFDDPPALAKHAANEAESLVLYRQVRDQIRAFVESADL